MWVCDSCCLHTSVSLSSGSKLWWADDGLALIGTVRKKDGQNMAVLRTKTTGVVQIRVYDKDGQKGMVATSPVRRIIMRLITEFSPDPMDDDLIITSSILHRREGQTSFSFFLLK